MGDFHQSMERCDHYWNNNHYWIIIQKTPSVISIYSGCYFNSDWTNGESHKVWYFTFLKRFFLSAMHAQAATNQQLPREPCEKSSAPGPSVKNRGLETMSWKKNLKIQFLPDLLKGVKITRFDRMQLIMQCQIRVVKR